MGQRINPKWLEEREKEIKEYLSIEYDRKEISPVVIPYNPAAQWFIKRLDELGIHCSVINMGAGVKKIVPHHEKCKTCNGQGFIK